MAGTFKFELVTPERMALSEDVAQVVVPGVEGEFTVLPGHAPVISALRPGVIEVALPDAQQDAHLRQGRLRRGRRRPPDRAGRARHRVEAMDAAVIAAELETAEAELAAAGDDASRLAAASAVERLRALGR